MKRMVLAALLAALPACVAETVTVRDRAPVGFYDSLASYGAWVDVEPYGQVWQPAVATVGADFYPYLTGGSWQYADFGWQFETGYPWGWITFHHGRWLRHDAFGWVWVPGDQWAPAWVEWRMGVGYIGWVPLGPAGVTTYDSSYHPRWCFVPVRHFGEPQLHRHRAAAWHEYSLYHSATAVPFDQGRMTVGPPPELVVGAGGHFNRMVHAQPRMLPPGAMRAEPRFSTRSARRADRPLPPAPVSRERDVRMPPPPGAPAPSAAAPSAKQQNHARKRAPPRALPPPR